MTLGAIVDRLETFDDDDIIFAERGGEWTSSTHAVVARFECSRGIPVERPDLEYLLEICLAREVIEVWRQWRHGMEPSLLQKVKAIVHYAKMDAYLPVEEE